MPGMTFAEMAGNLRIGDVVVGTGVLEAFPSHTIKEGARFVVVTNDLSKPGGALALRLAPDDAHLMGGDITDWGNCHMVPDPYELGYEDEPGTPSGDRLHPGSAWNTASECIERAPDALTLPERVAAVFAARLSDDLEEREMAEVVWRNAAETNANVCHSHDFCDANTCMLRAFEQMGLRSPVEGDANGSLENPESEKAIALCSDAWGIAKSSWFVASSRIVPGQEPDNDDDHLDDDDAPAPHP